MSVSLEDQRRALLEHIEASRAVYRRMLSGSETSASLRSLASTSSLPPSARAGRPAVERRTAAAPRPPAALQWALDHPLWVAGGVALLVLLTPRVIAARQRRTQRAAINRQQAGAQANVQAGIQTGMRGQGVGRALFTAALLLLRDPGRLRAAGRAAGVAWQWLQQRRTRKLLPPSVRNR